jgi:hypothetical protein
MEKHGGSTPVFLRLTFAIWLSDKRRYEFLLTDRGRQPRRIDPLALHAQQPPVRAEALLERMRERGFLYSER